MNYKLINYKDVKHIKSIEYFNNDKFSSDMFNVKYCKIVKDGIETPADVFHRIAFLLSRTEKNKNYYCDMWFSLMWDGWFRPGGSVISGVGSVKKQSLLNCTHVPLKGDTLEDINKCDFDIMKTAAYRQGIGFDATKLRPKNSQIDNAAEISTGCVPWIDKLVGNGKYVGQKGRMPALLVSLDVGHPDIEEFITCKLKMGQIENANISVQITDEFMTAVNNKDSWELKFEFADNKYKTIIRTVDAFDLFDLISTTAYKSAEPGVQYINSMRKASMVHQIYNKTLDTRFKIIGTNACSEKPLPSYSGCNLLSINMEKFSTNERIYTDQLKFIVPFLVRLSDNVIEYEFDNNLSPLKEQKWIINQTREIGCGITNLHGWFLKDNLQYESDIAIKKAENFIKIYAFNVFKSSVKLGQEKGNAPAFDRINVQDYMESIYFKNIVDEFYNGDSSKITHMRNLAHMSIAPTGSLSNTFPHPCVSSGIEPIIAPYYWRKTRAINKGVYINYFVIPIRIKEYLCSIIPPDTKDYVKMNNFSGSIIDNDGVIGEKYIKIINKYLPKGFFKPAHEINYLMKIELMSKIYKWIDAAISCTYNLPKTATANDVKTIYKVAYEKGIRGVSVYVDGSREGVLTFKKPKIDKSNNICNKIRPIDIVYNCAPVRPKTLNCDIYHTSIKGEIWIVLVGIFNNKPFEVFCGSSEDLYLPKACKTGKIIKNGNGVYSLEVKIRNNDVVYKNIAEIMMTDNQKALTRIISLGLRHAAMPRFIVDQLKKSNGDITAFATALSRVLSKYIKNYILDKKNSCPICGDNSLIFVEGCVKCANEECTYSRCG
jgi:ribonucleoside-diphosphate reductase alpha chain